MRHAKMINSGDSELYVSAVEIRLAGDSSKTIESIKVYKKDELLKEVEKTLCAGEWHREEFIEPIPLNPDNERIHVLVKCSAKFNKETAVSVEVNLNDIKWMRKVEGDIRWYRCEMRNIEVVVTAHQQLLTAIMAHILHVCPRFRLLVIGNSGAGKSTLLCKLFGVKEVEPSEHARGIADIGQEFVSTMNEQFAIHESPGFEDGNEGNMEIVKEFVAKRKAMPEMEDQLHAVWLCLEIPYAGGRLVDTGAERFLRQRNKILGDIPLVVALTKVDLLDAQLKLDQPKNEILETFKEGYIKENCDMPLYDMVGKDVPHVFVSTEEDYEECFGGLLQATKHTMENYRVNKVTCATEIIAQRVSIKEKIELSIRIGKKRYWSILLKAALLGDKKLKNCLQVILTDAIAVWNFNVPDKESMNDLIIEALLRTDNLAVTDAKFTVTDSFTPLLMSSFKRSFESGDATLIALRAIAKTAITVPERMYQLYEVAKKDATILMAFLVDIICLMQIIFLLISDDRPLTPEMICLALYAYEQPRKIVHLRIADSDAGIGVLPGGRDRALEKVERLIWFYSISDQDIVKLRQMIPKAVTQGLASGSS